ncbi:MAG: ComF family protein [Candidatus Omnitrophica bacterium]|nr:ComF family protein [Candidatus Omnitrophota bacterium]
MKRAISALGRSMINMVFPMRCVSCGKDMNSREKTAVCGFCMSKIRLNPKPYCVSCGRSVDKIKKRCRQCENIAFHFKSAHAACLYEGTIKDLLHAFKYKSNLSFADILSKLMIDFVKDNRETLRGLDMITSVPLGRRRLNSRGFNQSKLLADRLSEEFSIPYVELLNKRRHTGYQSELPKLRRLSNLSNAFEALDASAAKDKRVLLIDDVMTTGATLNECSRTLLASGAREVRCLVLARGA